MSEFKTAREAEAMLRDLRRASRYCTGEENSRRHGQRIREVEAEAERLREREAKRDRR